MTETEPGGSAPQFPIQELAEPMATEAPPRAWLRGGQAAAIGFAPYVVWVSASALTGLLYGSATADGVREIGISPIHLLAGAALVVLYFAWLAPKVSYRRRDSWLALIPVYGLLWILKIGWRVARLRAPDWVRRDDELVVTEPVPARDGLALPAAVLGVLGGLTLVSAPAALVLGILSLVRIRHHHGGGRGLALSGIVLGIAWLALYALVLSSLQRTSSVTFTSEPSPETVRPLTTADCLEDTPAGAVDNYQPATVACTSPHHSEVFATFDLPAGPWTGPGSIQSAAVAGCREKMVDLDPSLLARGDLTFAAGPPTQAQYDAGNHAVACLVRVGTPVTVRLVAP